MTRRSPVVTIGAGEFTATCPVPRDHIGLFEGLALSVRGRWDARGTQGVPDEAHTHTLHGVQARHRKREAEAVRLIDGALSAVDSQVAVTRAALQAPIPEGVREPTQDELRGLPRAQRMEWAERVRVARAAAARDAAAAERRIAAQTRREQLLSARSALVVEGADVRRQWREAYEMRAARYTRARFGRRGARMTATPAIAPYGPVDPPTAERAGE
ncbi:hypothetical protein [Microbacterium sp. P5_E9]